MMKREIRSVHREFTPEELADWKRRVAEVEAEKDEIIAAGRAFFERHLRTLAGLQQVLQLLRAERERQGVSLSDLQQRTGIDRGALSRLENAKRPNPTISTLQRYAEALDQELVIGLRGRDDGKESALVESARSRRQNPKSSKPTSPLQTVNLDSEQA